MKFSAEPAIPILRVFDLLKAHEFYVDYLGFTVDWEHQFDGHGPTYTQISRGALVLHLSEHHGDGTPGSAVYIPASGIRELHAELQAKAYAFLNPGIDNSPGDDQGACLNLLDPCNSVWTWCHTMQGKRRRRHLQRWQPRHRPAAVGR